MKFVLAASAAIVLACACSSTPPAAGPAAAVAPAKPAVAQAAAKPAKPVADPNKVICHSDTPIGQHVPVETCHTRAEWAELNKAQSNDVRDVQRSFSTQSGVNPSGAPSSN